MKILPPTVSAKDSGMFWERNLIRNPKTHWLGDVDLRGAKRISFDKHLGYTRLFYPLLHNVI